MGGIIGPGWGPCWEAARGVCAVSLGWDQLPPSPAFSRVCQSSEGGGPYTPSRMKGLTRSPRRPRIRWVGVALSAALALCSLAESRTVKIVQAQTLELRNIENQELVVITGPQVELTIDDDVVRAKRVEFNRTRRTLTLIGDATYRTAKDGQTLGGDNLVVNLGDESLSGEDVLISDTELEIRGEEVERVPGQIRARGGYFTLCAKCGRTPNDYAFRASRLTLYPGDRLVAYQVQVLVADHPVLYLPVIVLPLGPEDRQPRLAFGNYDPDGLVVEADLPFSIGDRTLGTTLLRYYENRSPSYGVGVDLRSYDVVPYVDRVDLYTLLLPRPFAADGSLRPGQDLDLNFRVRGRVPLPAEAGAGRTLDYSLALTRRDIGRLDSDPERGVTRSDFRVRAQYPLFAAEFIYLGRYGADPLSAVTFPYELVEGVLDPVPFSVGRLNADFKVKAGNYSAASNPLSPSASAQGLNITTSRLEEAHQLRYSRPLWKGADAQLTNSFVGRYYGTGARTVQLELLGQVTQRWAGTNSFTVSQRYTRNEGTSPFAFDVVPSTLSAPLSLQLSTVPVRDVNFGISLGRDPFLAPEQQSPATLQLSVNRLPVSASFSLGYNFGRQELQNLNYSVSVGDPNSGKVTVVPAVAAVPATPTTPAQPAQPAFRTRSSAWPFPRLSLSASGGYSRPYSLGSVTPLPGEVVASGVLPLTLRATVTGDDRLNTFSVASVYNFDYPEPLSSLSAEYNLTRTADQVLNPVNLSGRETFDLRAQRLDGNTTLTWRGYSFGTSHSLSLAQAPTATSSGTINFSVGRQQGRANTWLITYGGPYDLVRGGFTRPELTGSLNLTQPGQRLSAVARYSLRGLDWEYSELSALRLDADWQKGRFSVAGRASYARTRASDGTPYDLLIFDPLRVGVGLGRGERPEVYVTAALRQTLRYVNGVRQENDQPFGPVVGVVWDRCCWAVRGEADFAQQRYSLSIGLPGQFYPLVERGPDGTRVPLLPFSR